MIILRIYSSEIVVVHMEENPCTRTHGSPRNNSFAWLRMGSRERCDVLCRKMVGRANRKIKKKGNTYKNDETKGLLSQRRNSDNVCRPHLNSTSVSGFADSAHYYQVCRVSVAEGGYDSSLVVLIWPIPIMRSPFGGYN